MKKLLVIAWRNIWRHPARSGVLLAAIVAGLWAGVVTTGITNGMMQQRMNYMIDSEITHAQVHHPEFRTERKAGMYIPGHEEITARLADDDRVASYTTRVISSGMLQSPVKTAGVMIRGIDPEKERQTTTFHENLTGGDYLDVDFRNPILLGESLARDHNMEPGNRVVLTFEDMDGELTSAAFNVAGTFRSASSHFDDANVFVRAEDLNRLLAHDQPMVHEIAMMLTSDNYCRTVVDELNEQFDGIKAGTWYEISPELGTLQAMSGIYIFILTGIILIALAFGILNTMLMALFERVREIGVLISIGMSRIRVFLMITFGAIIISLSGAFVGILLAALTVNYLSSTGINLEMFAAGIEEIGAPATTYGKNVMPRRRRRRRVRRGAA
jgi:ABC-type lipoprotein release transport system permease subunit